MRRMLRAFEALMVGEEVPFLVDVLPFRPEDLMTKKP